MLRIMKKILWVNAHPWKHRLGDTMAVAYAEAAGERAELNHLRGIAQREAR